MLKSVQISDDLPKLIKGSGTPVGGLSPKTTLMLRMAWKKMAKVKPAATIWLESVGALNEMTRPLQKKIMKNLIDGGEVEGDPMEKELIEIAYQSGAFDEHHGPVLLIHEIPFDSRRKMMSVTFKEERTDITWVFTKGAPDVVLDKCSYYQVNGEVRELTDDLRFHQYFLDIVAEHR